MFRLMIAACLSALIVSPTMAEPVRFDGNWKTQRFSLFSSNSYGFGGNRLDVVSDASVSLAYRAMPESVWGAERASWSWQVQDGVPATDLRRKGGDDRNLALYFVFLPQGSAQQLKGTNVRKLLQQDDARVLVYVWGGAHNRGAVLDSPYLGARGKTVVLRGSGTGTFQERVDLAADYRRAFGSGSGALVGLAVSGDSDDTNSKIVASIADLQVN